MGVVCLEFHGENFRGCLKNREIRESFSLENFPLYGISMFSGTMQGTDRSAMCP